MKGKEALFSHKNDDWETPQELFDKLNKEFNFWVDLAANKKNSKCGEFFIPDIKYYWDHKPVMGTKCYAWCNPPYSNQRIFVEYVIKHRLNSVFLLPARTDTRLFHELIYPYWRIFKAIKESKTSYEELPYTTEVRFIKGRLKFKPSKEAVKEWEDKLLTETKPSKIKSLKTQIAGDMPSGFPSMIVIFRFN